MGRGGPAPGNAEVGGRHRVVNAAALRYRLRRRVNDSRPSFLERPPAQGIAVPAGSDEEIAGPSLRVLDHEGVPA